MKLPRIMPLGLVAGGYSRYVCSEEFRALERAVRLAVEAEFAPGLAAASGWVERLRLQWKKFCATQQALKRLRPSLQSCFSQANNCGGAR